MVNPAPSTATTTPSTSRLLSLAPPPSTPTVDITSIEQQKENILPLASGRSAAHLVTLASQSKSALEAKLLSRHQWHQVRIDAIEQYEAQGTWEEGKDGLTKEEVEQLSDDPLDIHHLYVRFISESYVAGASAQSRLIPLLESSTRQFLQGERYKNDPRYLRLWTTYARQIECPEDCYRFLFAKGVGDRLASLYEEYSRVLEVAGKRQQADQVYRLGIDRLAEPHNRLKKSYLDFQSRMLHAPPLPITPPSAPSTPFSLALSTSQPSSSRGVIGGASSSSSGLGTAVPNSNNSARDFSVFSDSASGEGAQSLTEGNWEDLGTIKSRKRENEGDATSWAGEKLGMGAKIGGGQGMKLEVFRDDDAPLPPTSSTSSNPLSRSIRGIGPTSEADLLRSNPFKNYSAADLSLTSIDPVIEIKKERKSSSSGKSKSSSSSSRSKDKATASSSKAVATDPKAEKPKERVACDLGLVYPSEGVEYSFEELKMRVNMEKYVHTIDSWSGWKFAAAWDEEVRLKGDSTYRISDDGTPVLYDPETGASLYDFLPRPLPPSLIAPLVPIEDTPPPPTSYQLDSASPSPLPRQQHHLLDLSSPSSIAFPSLSAETSRPLATHIPQSPTPASPAPDLLATSPDRPFVDPRRPPSPTMNTRQAEAMMNDMFAHTIRFGGGDHSDDEDDDEAEEPSTEEEDSDEDEIEGRETPFFPNVPVSQASQFSEFDESQESQAPFVPFSQTASQMELQGLSQPGLGGDSFLGDGTLLEEEEDEEEDKLFEVKPLTLFRDAGSSLKGGFKPTRSVGTPMVPKRAFMVMKDETELLEETFEHEEEEVEEDDQELEDQLDLAYRRGEIGDGFQYGRRQGGENRYAPLIDNMTPITERTCEFGSATRTHSTLSNSQRSRRDSAFQITTPVMEEDEDDDDDEASTGEEDSEDEGDRAFVGFEGDSSSRRDQSSSESEEEDEEEEEEAERKATENLSMPLPPQVDESRRSLDSTHDWNSTRKEAQFDEDLSVDRSLASLSLDRSFDVSLNTSLPEGFTITGNQSGMTTGMLVTEANSSIEGTSISTLFENPCNPFHPATVAQILTQVSPPILEQAGVYDFTHKISNRLAELQKIAKRREIKAKSKDSKSKDRTTVLDEAWEIIIEKEVFSVREKLGEGAFGAVFRVALPLEVDPDVSMGDEELAVAVKIERPTNLWEFHILGQLHSRLPKRLRSSVVAASRLYAFQDESFLFLDFLEQGTLLDAVNKANESGISPPTGGISVGLEEIVAVFFVIELLQISEGFHSAHILHGDLKIDNCLVRLEVPTEAWKSTYDPTGAGGWSSKGLKIIDFGRSIDTTLFSPGQTFRSTLETDQNDCAEMREKREWTYEPDYFGIASIAFNLLFGRFIETHVVDCPEMAGKRKFVIGAAFKRYHQVELWTKLFDALLNPREMREDGALPITGEIAEIRIEMEEWLVKNCDKNGKSLKRLLVKMEGYLMASAAARG